MSVSLRWLVWAGLALLLGMLLVVLPRSTWGVGVYTWLAQEQPWLARLLDRHWLLIMLSWCWWALRQPRMGPGALLLVHATLLLDLIRLSIGWFLGVSLGLLAAVALVARPWPNRAIMAHCVALAGLAVVIDAVVG